MHIWESENHFKLEVTELTDASCVIIQNFIFEVSYFAGESWNRQYTEYCYNMIVFSTF